MNAVKSIFKPLASLRLTVTLLALSILLIFAGTLAQRTAGIETVKHKYFHTWFAYIEFQNLAPFWKGEIPYGFMMLGGWSLIVLLLANLLTAHALRFKPSWRDLLLVPLLGGSMALLFLWQDKHPWPLLVASLVLGVAFIGGLFKLHAKRAGVIVLHIGLILLLSGELITSVFQTESQMVIEEGGYANFSVDHRSSELAIIDPNESAGEQTHLVVPSQKLRAGGTITDPQLPFSVEVKAWYPNSQLVELPQLPAESPKADKGLGAEFGAIDKRVLAGTGSESAEVDYPSAYVTLRKDAQVLGTYMVSTKVDQLQRIEVGGKPYDLALRFTRSYKPFQIWLKDFQFQRFQGTEMAKGYTSIVQLVDPANGVNREVRIWMNHPLRYNGETYYQSNFTKNERTTILQVVRNPGWLMPYYSCSIVALGLFVHFGWMLIRFIRRRAAEDPAVLLVPLAPGLYILLLMLRAFRGRPTPPVPAFAAAQPVATPSVPRKAQKKKFTTPSSGNYTLAARPPFWRSSNLFPLAIALVVIFYFLAFMRTSSYMSQPPVAGKSQAFDFDGFARLPIHHQGRTMPMESLARDWLKVMSEQESFYTYDKPWKFGEDREGTRRPQVQFMLDFMTESKARGEYEFLRIKNPEVLSFLKLDERQKRYSILQLKPSADELYNQLNQAQAKRKAKKTLSDYEKAILDIGDHIETLERLPQEYLGALVVPPAAGSEDWRSVVEAGQALRSGQEKSEYVAHFARAIKAYKDKDPEAFNLEVKACHAELDALKPADTSSLGLEVFIRRLDPFMLAKWIYGLVVFPLAALSWMGWSKPFRRAAFAALLVTFVVHSLAILARILITGRPPVTTLYTSAVAIGWFAILASIVVEVLHRKAIATAVGALIGFVTLIIASELYMAEGDTMKQLQPVLDTNLWLWVHVQTVTIGYSATILAGFLGMFFIFAGVLIPGFHADARKNLSKALYGVIGFAMLFSFFGTTSGGIWADQSWGRFWGWDPKENGAVLIVCWNALILHARWAGLVRERGMAVLAVVGSIVTSWSWFGTNLLGVGLHSYGFMEGAAIGLGINALVHLAFVAMGLLPLKWWQSIHEVPPRDGIPFVDPVLRGQGKQLSASPG